MSNKVLEAAIVYLQDFDFADDLLADLDSLALFLNTNDFDVSPISPIHLQSILSKKKLFPLKKAKSTLKKTQETILKRYADLYLQIQTIPSLDEEITIFQNDVEQLESEVPIITQAINLTIPKPNPVQNQVVKTRQQLDDFYMQHQEEMLSRERELQLKEHILDKRVRNEKDIRVKSLIEEIESKLFYVQSAKNEFDKHRQNWDKTKQTLLSHKRHIEEHNSKLKNEQNELQRMLSLKEQELEQLDFSLYEKTKHLRSVEKALLQTNKQKQTIEKTLSEREGTLASKEKALRKQETELEQNWEKLHELKHDVISKQKDVERKELSLESKFTKKQNDLFALYSLKVKELESEYKSKLKRLDSELDGISVKKEHLNRKEESISKIQADVRKRESSVRLMEKKLEVQSHNELDEVKSIRSHTPKAHHRIAQSSKHEEAILSENAQALDSLIEIADHEITINPVLAKKTYKRIYELYQKLSVTEQASIHAKIVTLHQHINSALDKKEERI